MFSCTHDRRVWKEAKPVFFGCFFVFIVAAIITWLWTNKPGAVVSPSSLSFPVARSIPPLSPTIMHTNNTESKTPMSLLCFQLIFLIDYILTLDCLLFHLRAIWFVWFRCRLNCTSLWSVLFPESFLCAIEQQLDAIFVIQSTNQFFPPNHHFINNISYDFVYRNSYIWENEIINCIPNIWSTTV